MSPGQRDSSWRKSSANQPADLSWVTESLALGGRLEPERMRELAHELGIRRVVDLRAEVTQDPGLLRQHGIEYLRVPTTNFAPVPLEILWQGVLWVRENLNAGHRVLIHCEYG